MSDKRIIPHLSQSLTTSTVEKHAVSIDLAESENNIPTTSQSVYEEEYSAPLTTSRKSSGRITTLLVVDAADVILAIFKTLSDPCKRIVPSSKPVVMLGLINYQNEMWRCKKERKENSRYFDGEQSYQGYQAMSEANCNRNPTVISVTDVSLVLYRRQ